LGEIAGDNFEVIPSDEKYRARYYDPAIGRFLSEDPLGFSGDDENLYAYVGNDPTDLVDPLGLQSSTPRPAPSGGKADDWTYGEIGQFGIHSLNDFSSPAGLADAKASIAGACSRQGGRCNAGRSRPHRPGDIAAWNNIVNATGGTDLSGGGELMCVNTQDCYFVHTCNTCQNNKRKTIERATPLTTTGIVIIGEPPNQGILYFYHDPLQGWDTTANRASACRVHPRPRPRPRKKGK
jgi:RHS repeat-associated protein